MRTKKTKAALTGLVLVLLAALVGPGTFATFTAQTTNPSNQFASGTLVLSNTKQGGTTCYSTAAASTDTNANGSCDSLLNLTVKKPGDEGSANLTVKDEGSLAASDLRLWAGSCTNANATGESYNGTGTPCSKVQLYVQQYSDAAWTTPSVCLYGGGTATTCDFSDATKTLVSFVTSHGSQAAGKSLGALAAGGSVYVKVAMKLPADADNTFQGRSATIPFNWYAVQ